MTTNRFFLKKVMRLSCLLIICVFLLSGCSKNSGDNKDYGGKEKYTAAYFDYFDTVTNVVGYEENKESFDDICAFIESELDRYDKLYDAYDSLTGINNMYYVNKHAAEGPVTVDSELIDLFKYGKEIYTLTGGKTNFAMGSVFNIWHEHREDADYDPALASVPSLEELQAAAAHCDINDVVIDEVNSTIYYSDPMLRCDVGAFAKGYAIERIVSELVEKGITGYTLNVGGNVRSIGAKPNGDPWSVAIQNPDLRADSSYVEIVKSADSAITTSGSYQRYYYVDDVRYHHIIDPDTLFPNNTYLSVSIINTDAGIGDALSTALFNMTVDEGKSLIATLGDTAVLWILADGTKIYSDNFPR